MNMRKLKETIDNLENLNENLPDNEYAGLMKGKNLIII